MRIALLSLLVIFLLLLSSCSSPLLDERFYDNNLDNWQVIEDPDTVEIPANWRVEKDGWLHQRSNIWGKRGDFLGRWYGTFIVAGDTDWTDYRLAVTAKPEDDDGFGVVVRFKDESHFYRLFFLDDTLSGGPLMRLDKREGADYTELWSDKKGYDRGKEIFIEVEATGDIIRAFKDGKLLCEVRDQSYKQGKIGLFCYSQSHQLFDNVRVTSK
ncbi:MAG: hypothetical protein AB1757_21900 [Acidobacteriota bacterium]